jgi:hypothetical protein
MGSIKLISFHGKESIKDFYLNRLIAHSEADEIIQGTYWQDGRGCGAGCTVHSRSHESYESELGIPRILARLEDRIFEGLPNEKAKEFPIQFLDAIPVGVDLEPVWRKFMIWLLIDENEGVIRHAKTAKTKKVIKDVAKAFSDKTVSREKWATVRRAAYAAAYATEYAVDADAYAVTATAYAVTATAYTADAAYADAANVAADAPADAATHAAAADATAYAADAAADATADAATHAAAADAADAGIDARNRKYVVMSEKLIELLKDAK